MPVHRLRLRPRATVGDARRRRRRRCPPRTTTRRRSQTRRRSRAEQRCERRCERFARRARAAPPRRYEDQSAPLRGEAGEPVDDRARPRLGDRRDPVRLAPVHALRDPLPGDRARCASARSGSSSPARASATTRGARATGGRSTGCGARCTSRTAPTRTRSASRRCPATASATCSATASSSEIESVHATEEIDADGLIASARIVSGPDRSSTLEVRAARVRGAAPGGARRAPVAVPARDVPRARRRRPHRPRLGRVEPRAALT